MSYSAWTMTYSNEDFDRAQALAQRLTDEDRAAGRPAPAAGYSHERFNEAMAIVRDSQN